MFICAPLSGKDADDFGARWRAGGEKYRAATVALPSLGETKEGFD